MDTIDRIASNSRLSGAVSYNGMVFLSGQTANDRSQDFRGQLADVLAKLDKILAEAGTDKSRLLSAQIWMKDIAADFPILNELWGSWLAPGCAPTRATAQCEMGLPDILVEVIVTAAQRG
jgi:enamine deaminase RidA (YjgF/YER057c/UK114 family)